MSLVEASSLCEGLEHREAEPDKDDRALERLGRWLVRFSPIITPLPPDAIAIDVTGTEGIFGSQIKLLALVENAFDQLNIHAAFATAPTLGAAWAMAYSLDRGYRLIEFASPFHTPAPERSEGGNRFSIPSQASTPSAATKAYGIRQAIEPLPLAALRIDAPALETLNHLGVQTIGQLLRLPRSTLPSRFGALLLKRIDQALGVLPEPLVALPHVEPIVAATEFDGKVESFESLEYAIARLLDDVLPELRRRACGARKIHLDFLRQGSPAVRKTIALSQPSRHRWLLMNLLRCTLETLECDEGFIGLRLEVIGSEKVLEPQLSLFEQEEQIGRSELTHLVERLRLRLGEQAVQGGELVESHAPESAARRVPLDLTAKKPAQKTKPPRRVVRKALLWYAADGQGVAAVSLANEPAIAAPRMLEERAAEPRPLRLFASPVEVRCIVSPSTDEVGQPATVTLDGTVHRVVHAVGPERITGVWWEGRDKTRDYYDVELPSGRRLWIFQVQENRRWFWQGEF